MVIIGLLADAPSFKLTFARQLLKNSEGGDHVASE
jgi:hypothetical protein